MNPTTENSPRSDADSAGQRRFPCAQCGAKLEYKPGSTVLKCPYCSFENPIPLEESDRVQEYDFRVHLERLAGQKETAEFTLAKCDACAAEVQPPANATAFPCPFCGADIVATAKSVRLIKPHALLPFKIERGQALESFEKWIKKRWFAPTALKRFKRVDHRLCGMYVPHWTYDSRTSTRYTGQRGDDYWVTESYAATENGKPVTRTRQVKHIRWSSASGVVANRFDDLLVVASHSLPREHLASLEPWDLASLTGYRDEYLSGFRAESYQVDLTAGFDVAKQMMVPEIRSTICSDIGGDHQRISTMDTSYFDVTFKHLLLPVWIGAYKFNQRVFQVVVNARTGEVQGERPWSSWKIACFVVSVLLVIVVIAIFANAASD